MSDFTTYIPVLLALVLALTLVTRPCLKNKSCTNGYNLVNY